MINIIIPIVFLYFFIMCLASFVFIDVLRDKNLKYKRFLFLILCLIWPIAIALFILSIPFLVIRFAFHELRKK